MTVNLEKLSVKQLYKNIADLTHERDELRRQVDALECLFGRIKEVSGFKYKYFITSTGLAFSLATGEIKQLKPSPRDNKKNQYLFVKFEKNRQMKNISIHTMVAQYFIGEKPSPNHVVNHKDGNKQNNNASNLEWSTIAENTQHAYKTGLAGGRKHGAYKGPVVAENEDGFGLVFFDSAQTISAGFRPSAIRDAISKPWKKLYGFHFSRIETQHVKAGGQQ